jgi:hypothetical protein
MNQSIGRRVTAVERTVGNNEQATLESIEAEWIILFRTRLEGASVWSEAGGHVLWPIDSIQTRKAYQLMMAAQEERIQKHLSDTLHFCAEQDPYMLDANYPLLEYFLWTVLYVCWEEKCFRPFTIPVEICDLLLAMKPEESLHYRPCDWCYECGYGYPAALYGVAHDIKAFLVTRYSEEEINAMSAPYRGKACLLCGGEIMQHAYSSSEGWQNSPANRLRQAKLQEWQAEIEAVEVAEEMKEGRFVPHDGFDNGIEAAKADFMQRRARQKTIRIEHQPSVDDIQ